MSGLATASPALTHPSSAEDACRTFDLTARIPPAVVAEALASGQLSVVDVDCASGVPATVRVLERLAAVLESNDTPLRICVPSLGSPHWGDLAAQVLLVCIWLHTLNDGLGYIAVFARTAGALAQTQSRLRVVELGSRAVG